MNGAFSVLMVIKILISPQGTWQFMSTALVQDKKAPHTFVNDLESILYVILWIILLYSPSSLDTPSLTAFIQMVLDPAEYEGTSGSWKKDFLIGHSVLQHLTFEG
jgi:hypothetical protein